MHTALGTVSGRRLPLMTLFMTFLMMGFWSVGWGQIANHVVISEIYGSGGLTGATYQNDFVELYNPTPNNVSVAGWTLQYASGGSISKVPFTITPGSSVALTGSIPAYGFYLIKMI